MTAVSKTKDCSSYHGVCGNTRSDCSTVTSTDSTWKCRQREFPSVMFQGRWSICNDLKIVIGDKKTSVLQISSSCAFQKAKRYIISAQVSILLSPLSKYPVFFLSIYLLIIIICTSQRHNHVRSRVLVFWFIKKINPQLVRSCVIEVVKTIGGLCRHDVRNADPQLKCGKSCPCVWTVWETLVSTTAATGREED